MTHLDGFSPPIHNNVVSIDLLSHNFDYIKFLSHNFSSLNVIYWVVITSYKRVDYFKRFKKRVRKFIFKMNLVLNIVL